MPVIMPRQMAGNSADAERILGIYLTVEMPTHRLSQQTVIALRLELVEGLIPLQRAGLQCQAWRSLRAFTRRSAPSSREQTATVCLIS